MDTIQAATVAPRFEQHELKLKKTDHLEEVIFAQWEDDKPLMTNQIRWYFPAGYRRMWITGDYSDWVAVRGFWPVMKEKLSRSYFREKIESAMGWEATTEYNEDQVRRNIDALVIGLQADPSVDRRALADEHQRLMCHTEDEYEYISFLRDQLLGGIMFPDSEGLTPNGHVTKPHLQVIMAVYDILYETQPQMGEFK